MLTFFSFVRDAPTVGGKGVRVKWGVLQEKIPDSEALPDEAERERRRQEAGESLVNIDKEERKRRLVAGGVGMAITAVAGVLLAPQPWYMRYIGFSPLLGLSLGFLVSGQSGL